MSNSEAALSKRLLFVAMISSLLLTGTVIQFVFMHPSDTAVEMSEWWKQEYQENSHRVNGYPERFPVNRKTVLLQVEESLQYSFGQPNATKEWRNIQQDIPGTGSVRLGKDHRGFVLPMFHELHCVQNLRDELLGEGSNTRRGVGWGHVQHCANYLRQWTLCRADLTLEPGDFAERDFTLDRTGATHECLDWTVVFDTARSNWDDWVEYWRANKLSQNLDKIESV